MGLFHQHMVDISVYMLYSGTAYSIDIFFASSNIWQKDTSALLIGSIAPLLFISLKPSAPARVFRRIFQIPYHHRLLVSRLLPVLLKNTRHPALYPAQGFSLCNQLPSASQQDCLRKVHFRQKTSRISLTLLYHNLRGSSLHFLPCNRGLFHTCCHEVLCNLPCISLNALPKIQGTPSRIPSLTRAVSA